VEGDTDWKLRAQVLTYSRARGAFAGITLNGAAIHQDDDATRALYGKEVPFRSILTGKVPAPAGAEAFLAAVRKNFVVARANERREERRERAEKQAESSAAGTTSGGTSGTVAGSTSAPSSKSESSTTAVGSSTQTTTSSAGTSSGAMTQSPAGASASADVKSKIEDALRNEPNLSSSNVQINVTENTVELSGSVPTASDKATVRRIVEANAGGRRVVDDKLIVK
jgi:osmotically-inducible protein OsmY